MKKRLYELKCNICGHVHVDTYIWKQCLKNGCNGKYTVKSEYPASI